MGASVDIEVTATSARTGRARRRPLTIAVEDAGRVRLSRRSGATRTRAAERRWRKTSAAGTAVGITAFASDADATLNGVTYSLSDNAGGRFAINATTGVVTVAGAINREVVGASLGIEVTATSQDGSSAVKAFADRGRGCERVCRHRSDRYKSRPEHGGQECGGRNHGGHHRLRQRRGCDAERGHLQPERQRGRQVRDPSRRPGW